MYLTTHSITASSRFSVFNYLRHINLIDNYLSTHLWKINHHVKLKKGLKLSGESSECRIKNPPDIMAYAAYVIAGNEKNSMTYASYVIELKRLMFFF